MAYQSFPWSQGNSRSFEKLVSLYLPVLKGKTLLDVGCNTGYFCGWAAFQGALKVKGIDTNPEFIRQAASLFPECTFSCMSWDDLGPEKFDIILCVSAIHYARDQQGLLDLLMERLTPDGVLALEIGCAPGDEETFVAIKRSIDTRLFPTRAKIHAMLSKYAFKYIRPSVPQAGDPVPRHIYHVYHARPFAVTFLGGPYSGKTSAVKALIRPDIFRIHGDAIYHQIADGALRLPPALRALMACIPPTRPLDCGSITQIICGHGLLGELLSVFLHLANKKDFVLDHYIPAAYRAQVHELIYNNGYFLVDASLYEATKAIWTRSQPPYRQYLAYTQYLCDRHMINEDEYLAANPDVAEAVAQGKLPSGQYHYLHFGKSEKRKLRPE